MKKLKIEDSLLLLTDIQLTFRGNSLSLHRVLVDTGSGGTIVSTDLAESIGVIAEEDDMIYRITGVGDSEFVFTKKIDSIKIADAEIRDFILEVGAMNYGFDLDGIIGLDFLQKIKAINCNMGRRLGLFFIKTGTFSGFSKYKCSWMNIIFHIIYRFNYDRPSKKYQGLNLCVALFISPHQTVIINQCILFIHFSPTKTCSLDYSFLLKQW